MAQIDVQGLLQFYREEKHIFGCCPHCGNAFRLSDVKLTYGKDPPRDLLTRLQKQKGTLNETIVQLEDRIFEMQSEHAQELQGVEEKWHERVDLEAEKALERKKRDIRKEAIALSRSTTLGKTIERIAPMFSGFGHHPGDVRPIFEPIDFLVFDGLYMGKVTDLVLVEFKTGGNTMTPLQKSIRDTVEKKRVHFEERRMDNTVLQRLAAGRPLRPGLSAIEMRPDRGKKTRS